MTQKISRNFTCRQCEGNIGEAMEQVEKLCDDIETVGGFTYLGEHIWRMRGCCD